MKNSLLNKSIVLVAKVKQIAAWRNKYPAFAWCADLCEGWYLPAIEESKKFTLDNAVRNAINRTLADKDMKLTNNKEGHWYWSSTEKNEKILGVFCAWHIFMRDGGTDDGLKYTNHSVRAVSAF